MPRRLRTLVPILALLTGPALAQAPLSASSPTPADTIATFPERVAYRSSAERLGALPGEVLLLPVDAGFFVVRKSFTLLYEERMIRRLRDALTLWDGRVGIRPLASSAVGSGGRVFVHDLLGADADFTTTFGTSPDERRYHILELSSPHRPTFTVRYRRDPKIDFHGIGDAGRGEDHTSFRREDVVAELRQHRRLRPGLGADLSLDYHSTDTGPGLSASAPALIDASLPGFGVRAHYVAAGLSLRTMHVDTPGRPTRGNFGLLHVGYRQSLGSEDLSHLRVVVEAEQFLELFYDRVVSLRLGTDWRYAPGDQRVPFYEMAALGGTESLRGYREGRYRDHGVVFGTVTYRFPVWKLVEGTVFTDVGQPLSEPADLRLDAWEGAYGGSIRLAIPRGLLGELLVARSREQTRLLFNFQTAF